MSILSELSSQTGDRSESSNLKIARQCLETPVLLAEIAAGLGEQNTALAGDCAEVMTQIALVQPEIVSPFAGRLIPLLGHKNTRVRWEAMHALALTAALIPTEMAGLLPLLAETIRGDVSIIVRDYAVDAAANYAGISREAASQAWPVLKAALTAWDGKHAGHALKGLAKVASQLPELHADLRAIANEFLESERGVVRKAAGALKKQVG